MKRPKLYFQKANDLELSRLRIIYPDGSCEWVLDGNILDNTYDPCWAESFEHKSKGGKPWNKLWIGICKSQREAIKLMHNYDRKVGFPKAIYLGEL